MPGAFAALTGAFTLGIMIGAFVRPHPAVATFGLLIAVGLILVNRHRGRWLHWLLLLAVLAAGVARISYAAAVQRGTAWAWQGRVVSITGTLLTAPYLQGRSWVAVIDAEQVESDQSSARVDGRIWVQWRVRPGAQIGQRVRATGRLDRPAVAVHRGEFDQAAYLRAQGIFLWLRAEGSGSVIGNGPALPGWQWVDRWRQAIWHETESLWPGVPGVLLKAVLWGERTGLPDQVEADFRTSGAYALLAVSGLNVGAVAGLVMAGLTVCRLRRPHAALVAVPAVLLYALMTTGGASVWRAAIMAVAGLLTLGFGKRRSAWEMLALAALLLLLIQPFALLTPAFQLSFGGVAGILLWFVRLHAVLAPAGRRAKHRWQRIWWHVAGGMAVGVAAQVALMPLLLYWFGELAIWSVPVGMIGDLWLLASLVTAGIGFLFGGLPGLSGLIFRFPAHLLAVAMLRFTHVVAQFPGGYWKWPVLSGGWAIGCYVLLGLADLLTRRREPWMALGWQRCRTWCQTVVAARRPQRVACLGVLLLPVLASSWAILMPSGDMHLYVLDVGQGDALLLRTPGARPQWWLIDAGPAPAGEAAGQETRGQDAQYADFSGARADEGAAVVLPFLAEMGVKRLDVVVLTHPHQDHAGGLAAVLDALPIGEIWEPGFPLQSEGYLNALQRAEQRRIPIRHPRQGEVRQLPQGAAIRVLWPTPEFESTDPNEHSLVLQVVYGRNRWLLMGDAGAGVEAQLLDRFGETLGADFLKVGHHGSDTSTSAAFLQQAKPALAAISAGAGNKFRHPDFLILARLRAAGIQVARTDTQGTLDVVGDGQHTRLQGGSGISVTLGSAQARWPPVLSAW